MPESDNYSGQTIGNYLILEKLGTGEFGSVYRAQNRFIAERVVAIKVINEKYVSSPEECAHFLDEARVLLRLQHPYILPVFDIGEHEGKPYIVVEFEETGSLRSYIARQPDQRVPLEKALALLTQMGVGLHFAHQQHVVHRDLKPDNILINARGEAVLADFGISVEVKTSTSRDATISGTPPYMAPEQFQGIASVQSDQYALACIAYEMLAGRRPFQAISFPEWAIKHLREAPLPPRQFNPAIPVPVEQAILKAMAKERTQRFSDVAAFTAALSPQGIFPSVTAQTVLRSPAGQTVLGKADVTVGRAPDNTYVINDGQVSAHHALLRAQNQGHVIIDLNSRNKTYVNGQPIPAQVPHQLKRGDVIRVGETSFNYTDDISELPIVMPTPVLPPTPPVKPAPTPVLTPLPAQSVSTPTPVNATPAPGNAARVATPQVAYPQGQAQVQRPATPVQGQGQVQGVATPVQGQVQRQSQGQFQGVATPVQGQFQGQVQRPAVAVNQVRPVMQQQQQMQYQQPPRPRRSRWGVLIVLIVLVVLVVLGGFTGVLAYITHINPTPTPAPGVTPTPTSPSFAVLSLNQTYNGAISASNGDASVLTLTFTNEDDTTGSISGTLAIKCDFDFCTPAQAISFDGTVNGAGEITFNFLIDSGSTAGTTITFKGQVSSDNSTITNGTYSGSDGESGTWSANAS
jgi:serine/threonine protein kinase